MAANFAEGLRRFGPGAALNRPLSLRQSRRYCRRLARRHYENFTVISCLLPRRLRRHVAHIYAYCRWADDLADETEGPIQARELLDWWEEQLNECFRGRAVHPVFIALSETIREFNLPQKPFADLLRAFRQDQLVTRYESFDKLLEYCCYSANPVGTLVLHLGGCYSAERVRLADSICTGLQLANFCQDVANDWRRGRIYLPLEDCRRFGIEESDFARGEATDAFRRLLAEEVRRAESFLRSGEPLCRLMPHGLRVPTALFVAGGSAILEAIRRQNYDVWSRRPTLSKGEKLRLMFACRRKYR